MERIKKIFVISALCIMIFGLSGCGNRELIEFKNAFDVAIIKMPNGEVKEIDIEKWTDYDGEQIQITAKDGTVYLTSSYNCILIKKSNE